METQTTEKKKPVGKSIATFDITTHNGTYRYIATCSCGAMVRGHGVAELVVQLGYHLTDEHAQVGGHVL